MRITVEICMPVAVQLEVEMTDDDDFDIKHATFAGLQDITVQRVNENLDGETCDYILEKIAKAREDGK